MLGLCIRENMYIVPKSSIICLTHIKNDTLFYALFRQNKNA